MVRNSEPAPPALSYEEREWRVLALVSALKEAVHGLKSSLDERISIWEGDALDLIAEQRSASESER